MYMGAVQKDMQNKEPLSLNKARLLQHKEHFCSRWLVEN